MAVDEDEGGFADGWVEVVVHAGSGAGAERIGQGGSSGTGGGGFLGEALGWHGERGAAVYLKEDRIVFCRGVEFEVAGVDGFAGVVKGGRVDGPVGEGGFGFGFFGFGEVDGPVGA